MAGPIVSVIIPTHNRPQLLADALESVCSQTRLPDEIVVVDDASVVSYREVLERYPSGGRVTLRYHRLVPGGGGSAARNLGAELSRGEILMFLDDDDTWQPCKVERQLKIFQDHPEAGLVYSGRRAVDEHDQLLFTVTPQAEGRIHRLLLQRNYIGITSSVALRREVFFEAGGFDPGLPARQDYDLWIRATRITAVAYDPEPTVNWMIHSQPGKQISSDPVKYRQAVEAIFEKYSADFEALSAREMRRARSSQYVILAEKCAQAGSPGQYIYALKALASYPSAAALSRLLPYRFWLKLRSLLGRRKAGGGGRDQIGNSDRCGSRSVKESKGGERKRRDGSEEMLVKSYSRFERSAARLLDRFPAFRSLAKGIYLRVNYLLCRERGFQAALHPQAQIVTPFQWVGCRSGDDRDGPGELFFGYYDKTPWSPDGERLLLHRLLSGGPVEIVVFSRRERTLRVLDRSSAWNYQQGSMAQWLPGSGGRQVIFNDLVEGNLSSRIISLAQVQEPGSLPEQVIPWPVQAVHPSGHTALSINYRRLFRLRPEYGYAVEAANFPADLPLYRDGIWKVDLASGEAGLIITLADLAAYRPRPEMDRAEHKVNHLLYSPRGTRFVFLHRWLGPEGKFSRLFCNSLEPEGSQPKLLLDYRMISHYCWCDERYLLVWARAPEAGDAYYLVDTVTAERKPVGEGILDRLGDGHPSFSPDGRRLLTDSYPDRARQRHLLLYNLDSNRLVELGRFLAPWSFDGPRRSDLHPRWSPNGRDISIDSAHQGKRMSYILQLPPELSEGRVSEGRGT